MSRYFIIDNDAGIDDAWAIFVLLNSNPVNHVLALTCVNGNTSLDNVFKNNTRLLTVLNRRDIPVYLGARSQLIPPEKSSKSSVTDDLQYFHGKNGFGDVELPKMEFGKPPDESAVHAIYRLSQEKPGEVTLVCCGPLTNIALAIRTYPDFVQNVKEIFIMGGNYTATGNTTRCAEFNFHTDPEAAYIVLHEMEGKITLLPWETCMRTKVPFPWREELGTNCGPVVSFLNIIEGPIMSRLKKLGYKSYISADQLLAAVISEPELLQEVESLHASVELAGFHTRGQIVVDHLNTNKHNTKVIKQVNLEKYQHLLWSLRHL
uniref:Putative uridine nucleosidase 2 n=1 Tax=Lygus hesperus TaxID=30085 RepID=A0A0A9W0Q8_LYGHE